MFMDNKFLVHIDLSFNKIDQFETELISKDIIFNQTCVGVHYTGNTSNLDRMCAKIDSLGQMQMMENFFQNMSARTTIPDGSPERRKILQRRLPEVSKRGSTFSISSAQKPKESF